MTMLDTARQVSITVTLEADIDMLVGDLWPDDDYPDVITADVVKALMEAGGTKAKVLRDWFLLDELCVTVHVDGGNPAYTQTETLFGDPPQPRLASNAEVWK